VAMYDRAGKMSQEDMKCNHLSSPAVARLIFSWTVDIGKML
jgi:hypothetical protein